MVNNSADELCSKISKLSPRESQVLELRCQGKDYKFIAEKVFISVPAVKQYMSRVYVKLGLDLLPRSERTKFLYETISPLLQKCKETPSKAETETGEILEGKEDSEINGAIVPAYVADMVDDDEYPIIVLSTKSQSTQPTGPEPDGDNHRHWKLLIGIAMGAILGVCLSTMAILFIPQFRYLAFSFISQPTPITLNPILIPSVTSLLIQTSTPIPSPTQIISTQTPVVIQQVIVVTATPPPATIAPTLTQIPQPSVLFEDNFDQGLSNAWNVVSGNPMVVNGELTSDQNTWLEIGDKSWTDYTVQFTVQTADCWYYDNWNAVGVRVQDTGNMIAFKWAQCESEWDIVKNGNWSTVPNPNDPGANYYGPVPVVITVQGKQFAVDINGERKSSFFNADYKQGGVALRVGSKTQIEDFKITAIK